MIETPSTNASPRWRFKALSVCIVLSLLASAAMLLVVGTAPRVSASSGWWDINWIRRRSITITGNHPDNYQIKIVVPYDSDMRSDYGDLRFLENETASVLSYWIENYTVDNATIWVRRVENTQQNIDNIIYMYYGNPSASSASSGANTFVFFDGFVGTSLDTGRWTATGSYSVNNGITITTGDIYTKATVASSPQNLTFEMKAKYLNGAANYSGICIANAQSTQGGNGGSNALVYNMTPSGAAYNLTLWGANGTSASYNIVSGANLYTPTLSTNYMIGYSFYGSAQLSYFIRDMNYSDLNRLTYSGTWNQPFYLWLGYFTGSAAGGTDIDDITVSWVRVRKYASSEPSCTIGAEEVAIPSQPQLQQPGNNLITNNNTPTFQWIIGQNANNHRILVDNDADLLSPVDNVLLGATDNTWTKPSPGYADGVYYWKVVAISNGGENSSNIWNFTIDTVPPSKPTLVSPENNRLDNGLARTFTWTRPEPNVTYHIQIDDESGFSSPYVHENTAVGENTYNNTFSTGGTYYWRVRAKDQVGNWGIWSDNFKFVIDGIAPSAPTLLEPADGVATNDATPTLRWNAVSDPSAPVTYFIQADNDSNFSSPEINVSGLIDNIYTPTVTLADENYSWRVRARDNAGNWGTWSSTWTLLIDTIVETPMLLEPSNGTKINDNTPTFGWTIVSDNSPPVTYDLMVDNDSDFTSPEINVSGLSDNTYTPTSELADENYSWRISARDDLGNIGPWSSIWTFMIDTVPPEAPTLLTPADGTITDDNTPTLICLTVDDTSKSGTGEASGVRYYEFWVDNDLDFSSPEILENLTISTHTTTTELPGENYSWRVRAWDSTGNPGPFSSAWTFVIENFSISADPESLEIMRGTKGTVRLSVVKDYGPSENAALSGSWNGDLPDDLTTSFAPAENKMPFESTLTFDIGSSASPGTFTYRVMATSDYGMSHTTDVEVTIVSTIFTVGSYPRVLELMRGDTATSTVSVDYLLGKKETVFLSGSWIGAAPTDVVTSFSIQNGLPPFRSTLRFTTGKNATAGSFTYRVTGNGGGLTRTDDITVDIATNLTLTLNTDKTSYEKGQKIRISGTAKDPKENPVENGEATITLRSGKWTDQLVTLITDGTCAENYYITFDKPEGDWSISASAVDNRGNLGQSSENVIVSVSIPVAWKYYTITFLSPPPNTVCSRGEEVAVTVQITEGAEKISGADVYIATPSGEIITLAEGSPGIYSLVYAIRWDDPVGEWTVSVLGEKTVQGTYKAGTGSTSLDIAPADLKLELLKPSQRTFEVGEKVDIKVRVSYPNGSPVDGAIAAASLPDGENLTLLNEGEGTYRGTYSVSKKDLGAWDLAVSAIDAYGNSGTSSEVTLSFKELSPSSYPIRYWWITIPVAIVCVLTPTPIVVKKLRVRKLKSINSEIRATEKLRRELPERYFVKGGIPRETYDSLMHQSLEKLIKLKNEARRLQGKLERGK